MCYDIKTIQDIRDSVGNIRKDMAGEFMNEDTRAFIMEFSHKLLQTVSSKHLINVLISFLDTNTNDDFQCAIVKIIGSQKIKRAIGPLIHLLEKWKDKQGEVVKYKSIIWALGEIGDSRALTVLDDVIAESKDDELIYCAVAAMGKLKNVQSCIEDSLMRVLQSQSVKYWLAQPEAIEILGRIKSRRALPIIKKCLQDDDLRHYAIKALGEIGDPCAVPVLTRLQKQSRECIVTCNDEIIGAGEDIGKKALVNSAIDKALQQIAK